MLINDIKTVYKRISHAAMRAGRDPHDVRLIAVSKGFEAGVIKEAVEAGLRDFGENRVQEAALKISNLSSQITPPCPPLAKGGTRGVRWHLIGHLQKNKAKTAVELFDVIHSVDSLELAETINRQAESLGKTQDALVQVKLSDEETKHGISKGNIMTLLNGVQYMKNIRVIGLMTIPPYFEDPEMARPYFAQLRQIKEDAGHKGFNLRELSMGMSNDFEVAIEEGATMVRVGTALFGQREKKEAK